MDYRRDWVVGIDKYGNYFRHGPMSATAAGFVHSQESQRAALHVTIMRVPEGTVPPHAEREHLAPSNSEVLGTATIEVDADTSKLDAKIAEAEGRIRKLAGDELDDAVRRTAAYWAKVAGGMYVPMQEANPIVIKGESCVLGALPTAQARERVRIQGIVREELARTFRDARHAQRAAYSEMGRSDGTIPPSGGPITG